jgi:hypothetical protein
MMSLPPEEFALLSAYLDDALTTRQRQALEARLAASPELRAQLDDLRAMRAMLRAAPVLKPPRDFRLDPARYARRAWWSRLELLRLTGALSAVAAMLLLALGILLADTPRAPRDSIALQATDINTPTPAVRMLVAPTPTMPMPAAAPFMATVAPRTVATVAPLNADATAAAVAPPEAALEAAMLMATEAAPEGISAAAATETPELVQTTPEATLSPVARLLILLGALLLIIGGVLFFIGAFRARL